jgi:hypothetical protein
MRWVLWAGLVLAGCAAPVEAPPPPVNNPARVSRQALLAAFFGEGHVRAVSPVTRCGVRCGAVR